MPPGYVQIAGGYYMIESSSCGGGLISTASECEAAAMALGLSDKTATDYSSYTSWYSPPGCSLSSGNLYVWARGPGSCASSWKCICKSPSPLSPATPPAPSYTVPSPPP
eukprot:scaffold9220_cov36-Phaeocystis_antarctica.AAC.1